MCVHLVIVNHILKASAGGAEQAEPLGRVAQKRATRSDAILARASELVAAGGLEQLTLQRLGAAMGIVPAALYRYFDSKDALVAALQRRAVAVTHAAFSASQAEVEPSLGKLAPEVAALARLFAAARFYLDLPRTHPEPWLMVATLLGDPRPLVSDDESRQTAPLLGAFLIDVRGLVDAATSAGGLAKGDATLRTMVLWATLHGALVLAKARRVAPELPTPMDVGLGGVHALTLGWGASVDNVKRAARAAQPSKSASPRASPAKNGSTAKNDSSAKNKRTS